MRDGRSIVFVVDDDPSVRRALDNLLRSVGLEVQSFGSVEEYRQSERPDTPACLVLDVRMPGTSGLDFQRELLKGKTPVPVIFITAHGDIPMSVRAMKAGAVEFLPKPFRDQDLLDAIQLALEKDRTRRKDAAALAAHEERLNTLTPREREVMGFVVTGRLNKQIAAELDLSEITVKVARGQVMKKMQAKSLAELVKLAEKLGISSPDDEAT
jgi:FixJ family two-component response regulator